MRVLQPAENRELRFRKHVYYTEFGVLLIFRVDLREKRAYFSAGCWIVRNARIWWGLTGVPLLFPS